MPRTEVYQLRLTKAEKDSLGEAARAEGLSIAGLIRTALGLTDLGRTRTGREHVVGVVQAAEEEAKANIPKPNVALSGLTQQLKNQGYTTPVAERIAKERLGI